MTKRDVCIWFCKVTALVEIARAVFGLASLLFTWRLFGVAGLLRPALLLGLYLFVWFFSRGIGTELAAEGDYGPPIASSRELNSLFLRCAGLWLFLGGSLTFGPTVLALGYEYFFSTRVPSSSSNQFMMIQMAHGFLQSVIGFFLAFTPRIRAFLRS